MRRTIFPLAFKDLPRSYHRGSAARTLINDLHDLDRFPARGRADIDSVADPRLQKRAGDGGNPADLPLVDIGLVDADDGDGVLAVVLARIGDGGAEEDLAE